MKKSCYGLLALAVLYLVGCGSSSGGGGTITITPATLAGTWHNVSLRQDGGATVTCPGTLNPGGSNSDTCGANDHFTFTALGSFNYAKASGTSSGTYTVSGNTITISLTVENGVAQNPAKVVTAHLTLTSTTITVRPIESGAETGETLTFTKV